MDFDYDVVIIGGAFSEAATRLMLKRKRPQTRVLIIEKNAEFDRKVGESTTAVSSYHMTRILGLTQHLGHHQLGKQGLRFWFRKSPDQRFDDCVEIGTRYQSRLQTFLYVGFSPDPSLWKLVRKGLFRWWKAELTNLRLMFASPMGAPATRDSAPAPVEA
jgi:2-polyprenyl-6-methoxyphenol hydroxylase-like FAD-dependent oxidoreductase